jgi:hypothetical protein
VLTQHQADGARSAPRVSGATLGECFSAKESVMPRSLCKSLARKKIESKLMNFEDLNQKQTKFLIYLIRELELGDYESEMVCYANRKGCFIRLFSKNPDDENVKIPINETDLLHFSETGYFTVIKTLDRRNTEESSYVALVSDDVNYKIAIKPRAYEQYNKWMSPTENKNSKHTKVRSTSEFYIDPDRIQELRSIPKKDYDFSKLVRLCEELNACSENENFFAVAMITRAIIDHVPPLFGCHKFGEVANNYRGSKSFKGSMKSLDSSLRNIADHHLHVQIRKKETLPKFPQVNFSADLDVLLAEIVRIYT